MMLEICAKLNGIQSTATAAARGEFYSMANPCKYLLMGLSIKN